MFRYKILTYKKKNLFQDPSKPWFARALIDLEDSVSPLKTIRAETREKAIAEMKEYIKNKVDTIGENVKISDVYLYEKSELEDNKKGSK